MLFDLLVQGAANAGLTYMTAQRPTGSLTVFGSGQGVMGVVGDARFLVGAGAAAADMAKVGDAGTRKQIRNVGFGSLHSLITTTVIKQTGPAAAQPAAQPEQLGYDAHYGYDPQYAYGDAGYADPYAE